MGVFGVAVVSGYGLGSWQTQPTVPLLKHPLAETRHVGNSRSETAPPWGPETPFQKIWETVNPQAGGDPTQSAAAVKSGLLEQAGLDPDLAARMLYLALDEDAQGISAYLLKTLASGRLDILQKSAPLPKVNAPTFGPLLAAYVTSFGRQWEQAGKNPLWRYAQMSPIVQQQAVAALAEAGPEALRLGAGLFPAEFARHPDLVMQTLPSMTAQVPRLNVLREALQNPAVDAKGIRAQCISQQELLLADLLRPDLATLARDQLPHAATEIETLVQQLRPTESLYAQAGAYGEGALSAQIKTEIIRKMANYNLVAATRSLAGDPDPPDEALSFAVRAMRDDPEAARAWLERIQDATIRENVRSELGPDFALP